MATWSGHLVLAAVAYVPLLRTAPGQVGADTKLYLYLHPARFMSQVASMWDPDVAMGSVTHQYIGYLLPMGPYYASMQGLGVPTWVAQRLWTGSLLFLAGAGVLFLLRTLSPVTTTPGAGSLDMGTLGGVGAMVAAFAYMLSPYVLQNEARASVLLLPWVGLPWMIGLVARALRHGGWRHPALFAVVVALVGSTNAASLVLVGVGPVLWVLWELVARRVDWRRALATTLEIGVLSAAVSLWWATGLAVEGTYGMDILRYTETIPTVARTSLASETLRGLGYWFFYGVDKVGLYLPMAGPYMTSVWLLAVSFAVPAAAFLAAFVTRWRERAFFVTLIVVGTIMSVGAHPLSDPSPLGRLIKAGATGSTVGLALRSTNRATPLVVLGVAVLLGAGVAALARRWRIAGVVAAAAATGLVAADLPALWTGQFVAANLSRPEHIPSYLTQAADYLDNQPGAHQTRVLTEPGIDFAVYNWGTTLEPVLPGLMTRPEVDRGLVPYGSPGSADLLGAVDEGVQAGTFDPSALAPMLRLMSAGDLVLESDFQYEHYDTPRPQALWQKLDPPPPGLGAPIGFGSPRVTAASPRKYPEIDETALGLPHDAAYPAPVVAFPVANARPILRTEGATTPMLVDGDGTGLVAAAGAGLLDGQATVFYSPSFASQPAELQRQVARGADLVVTDTNRRQAEQFGTVRENVGYTEMAGEKALVPDSRDARLPLFPAAAGDTSRTVAVQLGVKSVQASGYGNPITYVPEDRPDQAMDGNLRTVWTVGAFDDPVGQFLRITLDHPLTTDHVNLVQPLYGPRDRWITRATLRFDGGRPITVDLDGTSRTSAGQTVSFSTRTFTTLQITIDRTNTSGQRSTDGMSGVGFAEVRLGGQQVDEVLRMPQDLLTAAGASSASHRLTLVMTRQTAAPVPPRTDPEIDIARFFTLPTARSFSVSGTAELSPLVPDDDIDRLLGTTVPGVEAAYSSGRLPGALQDRASSTLDGDQATVWSPGLGPQAGNWLEYDLARPLTFDHLSMSVVADGRHSVPTSVTVSAGGQSRTVPVPALSDSTQPWATQTVTLTFPALTGTDVRLTFGTVRQVTDLDYYSDTQVGLPLGIAEVTIPGMPRAVAAPAALPGTCRSDLLTVDGVPVPVSITGTTAAAEALDAVGVHGCGSATDGITLGAGPHELQTQPGFPPGVDVNIDSLVLDSGPGGSALATGATGRAQPVESGPAPTLTVVHSSATAAKVVVHHPTRPFWMVLGESTNAGWHAITGTGADLGPPQLVDGYANGWLVTPATAGHDMVIMLQWTPQRLVSASLVVSGVSLALCLALGCLPRRWRARLRRLARSVRARPRRRARPEEPGVAVPIGPAGAYRRASAPGTVSARLHGAPPGASDTAAERSPLLGSPLRSSGARPGWVGLVVVPVVAGGVTAAVVTPGAGLPVAAAAFLAAATGYGRVVLAVGSVGLLVAVDRMVTSAQRTFHYAADFGWPNHVETASTLAWIAVAVLGADALVQEVRDRRARGAPRSGRRTSPNHPARGRHIRRPE
ncbi:MAG TPA: alpha-(1-_3)-arabinofuranosyltransferase family protein [Acidimicrobiales bacterium]|nr:alpha-(1->3)-arabinofuranosyltransferase family protein [Acidimicrobiales bacterium]